MSANSASIPTGQLTEKVSEIMNWLDNEEIEYTVKKGMFTENYTGVDIHLRDSYFMSIITEDAVIMGAFAESGIFSTEKPFLIAHNNLGYERETKRHHSMQELGEQINRVMAAAARGEFGGTTEAQ